MELFTHRFAAVARQMGERLRRTAVSTNVKERLDFSCALLDPAGELVVNAPHIPVHLGALGLCVRRLREVMSLEPGDVVVTNHPGFGGSHLPDVTVVTPVHEGEDLLGFVASRAHHAEIGGIRPGSMPPGARRLVEEGVVIPPTYLARTGEADWEGLRRLLLEAPYPTRAVEENLADLRAFTAGDDLHGIELWQSDGTEAGTRLVQDIAPQAGSSNPEQLTPVGDKLFFTADDGIAGREVWVLPLNGPSACQPSPTRLCLGGGRYAVEAVWRDFQGNRGVGHPAPLTADTGTFWFFDPSNVEVVLKVLDGNGVNGHEWVFYGALSNVEYTITVTDTQTGEVNAYRNPSGRLASVADTGAF